MGQQVHQRAEHRLVRRLGRDGRVSVEDPGDDPHELLHPPPERLRQLGRPGPEHQGEAYPPTVPAQREHGAGRVGGRTGQRLTARHPVGQPAGRAVEGGLLEQGGPLRREPAPVGGLQRGHPRAAHQLQASRGVLVPQQEPACTQRSQSLL